MTISAEKWNEAVRVLGLGEEMIRSPGDPVYAEHATAMLSALGSDVIVSPGDPPHVLPDELLKIILSERAGRYAEARESIRKGSRRAPRGFRL